MSLLMGVNLKHIFGGSIVLQIESFYFYRGLFFYCLAWVCLHCKNQELIEFIFCVGGIKNEKH